MSSVPLSGVLLCFDDERTVAQAGVPSLPRPGRMI